MTRLPYPGAISEKELQNLKSVEFKDPMHYIYFTIDSTTKPRKIFTLTKENILMPHPIVAITEVFGEGTYINIGTAEDSKAITRAPLRAIGWAYMYMGTTFALLRELRTPLDIYISIEGNPTAGTGWGLMQYLDLMQVVRV